MAEQPQLIGRAGRWALVLFTVGGAVFVTALFAENGSLDEADIDTVEDLMTIPADDLIAAAFRAQKKLGGPFSDGLKLRPVADGSRGDLPVIDPGHDDDRYSGGSMMNAVERVQLLRIAVG